MSISGELCRKRVNVESNDDDNTLGFDLVRRLTGVPPGVQVQAVDGGLSIHPHPPLVIFPAPPGAGSSFAGGDGLAGRVLEFNRLTDQ